MTQTFATPTGHTTETTGCPAALDRVVTGPWTMADRTRRLHQPLPCPVGPSPAATAPAAWYTRPLMVSLGVVSVCAAFWGGLALAAAAVL